MEGSRQSRTPGTAIRSRTNSKPRYGTLAHAPDPLGSDRNVTAKDLRLPQAGELIDGKYRIVRLLGTGGMGAVYAAYHELLRHEVALKILLPAVARNPEAVERFVKEARAASQLKSPNIAKVMDIGTLENGSAYMSMEYLEGQDLGTVLEERGALPIAEALDYVLQALEGLAHAHALGIVHRDVKPANLFVTHPYGGPAVVKVLDFGIAKATKLFAETEKQAASGGEGTGKTMLGSPSYMSPEQVRSSTNVDARTDVWAIGVTLYRLLLGRPPFDGESLGEILGAILQDTPPSPRSLRPEIPEPVDAAIMHCLTRAPDARWPSVAELAEALAPHAGPDAPMAAARIRGVLAEKHTEVKPAGTEPGSGRPAAVSRDTRSLARRQNHLSPRRRTPAPLAPAVLAARAARARRDGAPPLVDRARPGDRLGRRRGAGLPPQGIGRAVVRNGGAPYGRCGGCADASSDRQA